METTKNKLPEDAEHFFKELSEYLNTKLLYYGSVQREDYFHGKSDIDVDIFTDNENSTINKLTHFLHVKKDKFKRFVWKLDHSNEVVYGTKIFYSSPELQINVEFSIYNEKYKKGVIFQHVRKTTLPFYATILLVILKFIYYNMHFIDRSYYSYLKNKILSVGIGLPEAEFIVLNTK